MTIFTKDKSNLTHLAIDYTVPVASPMTKKCTGLKREVGQQHLPNWEVYYEERQE